MIVVGEAANASELLSVARDLAPDVVITDLRMPGAGVLDCIRSICGEHGPRVVVFTAFDDPTDASLALHAGASGYVLKQAPETHLLTAIRRAHAGRRFVEAPVAARIAEDRLEPTLLDRAARLSARESAVLGLVARGYTGRQIATELGLRLGTVETYRHRLRKKLGLRSRADVMAFARTSARLREPP
jgi:DNA-binding NarL/FixJ family response regulator